MAPLPYKGVTLVHCGVTRIHNLYSKRIPKCFFCGEQMELPIESLGALVPERGHPTELELLREIQRRRRET